MTEPAVATLAAEGHAVLRSAPTAGAAEAWALAACAEAETVRAWDGMPPLEVIGDFMIPVDASRARDFQAYHFDFGLPLEPRSPRDVARYTLLHVPADRGPTSAATHLADLAGLLGGRDWPDREALLARFAAYGHSHGAWDPDDGYVEGILGRVVEAAAGGAPELPSVREEPGFLCGTEFADAEAELRFLARHGLDVASAETAITLQPGDALVFDNLRVVHARRGRRATAEVHQLVFGHRALSVDGQLRVRGRILDAFA